MGKIFNPRFLNLQGISATEEDCTWLESIVSKADVTWIHTFKVANAFKRFTWPHSILDVDDFPSGFHASASLVAKTPREWIRRKWLSAIWRRHEALWRERFDHLCVCKEDDRKFFGTDDRVHVVPNGFGIEHYASHNNNGHSANSRIGMIGDFGYLANKDGINWFLTKCWPMIQKQHPTTELRLVGKLSFEVATSCGAPNVHGLGYVEDVTAEMQTWGAMIAPTRIGGGTSLKVVEGLARRVPVVATTHGSRGYPVVHGRNAMVADSSNTFSASCIRLLEDPALRSSIAESGYQTYVAHFSNDSIDQTVHRIVSKCLESVDVP